MYREWRFRQKRVKEISHLLLYTNNEIIFTLLLRKRCVLHSLIINVVLYIRKHFEIVSNVLRNYVKYDKPCHKITTFKSQHIKIINFLSIKVNSE